MDAKKGGYYDKADAGKPKTGLEQTAQASQAKFEQLRGKGHGGLMAGGAREVQTDRTFAKGTIEILEAAAAEETIGLVTKDKFIETQKNIAERLEQQRRDKGETAGRVVSPPLP